MRRLPLWIRSTIRCQPRANDRDLYLPLQQDFAELLSRQLPDDAFHLQIKERSQNFGRIPAGAFHDVINVHRLLGAERLVELFLRAIQRGGGQWISLLSLRPLGLQEGGTDGRGQRALRPRLLRLRLRCCRRMRLAEADFERRVFGKDDVLPAGDEIRVD